jgi:hypothetical protein
MRCWLARPTSSGCGLLPPALRAAAGIQRASWCEWSSRRGNRARGSGAVTLVTRSNLAVRCGGWIWLAVALTGSSLLVGCGSHHRAGGTAGISAERTAVAWPEAKAVRRARSASLSVEGRRPKVDPASIVCWGMGRGDRRGETRVWRRFRCIAPTFRGAEAGPDILFVLKPTGRQTFAIRNQRLSSY